jgi:hypothetical protein
VVFALRSVEELSVEKTAGTLGIQQASVRSGAQFAARMTATGYRFDLGGAHCGRIVAAVNSRLDE